MKSCWPSERSMTVRLRITVAGTVQGVGFRPFAYRLARRLELGGWVLNTPEGALLEVEGPATTVDAFLHRLRSEAPAAARIERLTAHVVPAEGRGAFGIRASLNGGAKRVVVPPDLATCAECRRELQDPSDRRFRYPFLTCTQCGPRFSILTGVPYDRGSTTMSRFPLCPACRTEYHDPADRRFHAEPLACPACGPRLALWDERGDTVALGEEALARACGIVREGRVLAVKGLGGFHLWVDARSESAVQRLRARKQRPHKPFAVLFPSLAALRDACLVSAEEAALLSAPQAPIVLLPRLPSADLAAAVAPDNPSVGAMLPYTPLHLLLTAELQSPVVATSGNRSDEPIVIDERDAQRRLQGIADWFLVHDRPIARPVDDSVVRMVQEGPLILRRARGYAPLPIRLKAEARGGRPLDPILAVGGHLKSTVAVASGDRVLLSQHLGDLSTPEADLAFRRATEDLQRLLAASPTAIACDLHPDYRSTLFARDLAATLSVPLIPVQHHHAHVAACMAEHGLSGDVLGIAWDGSGYGPDGTVWGGECLIAGYGGFRRFAQFRPFRLPGGECAVREPRRAALSVLWETLGEPGMALALPPLLNLDSRLEPLAALLRKGVAAPPTSSAGRLFDAVASLVGLCHGASFEGQAGMALECAAHRAWKKQERDHTKEPSRYAIPLVHRRLLEPMPSLDRDGEVRGDWQAERIADWRPLVKAIADDLLQGADPARMALQFHEALADLIGRVAEAAGVPRVVLTGGVFQNVLLARLARNRLERAGFVVYTHCLVPPNDGGLALGQAVVAAHRHQRARRPDEAKGLTEDPPVQASPDRRRDRLQAREERV